MISIFFSSTIAITKSTHASDDNGYAGLHLNSIQRYGIPLFTKQSDNWLSIDGPNRPILNIYPKDFKRSVQIDSTGKNVSIEESIFNIPLYVPAKYSLEEYTNYYRKENLALLWQAYKIRQISGERLDQRSGGGIEIAIPVRIRSRAFQTIFGGDRVSLSVTGQININGGLRYEKRSQVRDAYSRGSNYNFKMEQTQNFKVQGNVGDKVTVSVDQDSERPFDFENTVKLNYQGYDDEIIQSIQAGNISLSLPATRFVSFSAQNSGLFGIKSEAQVGNFHLTTIASQEKGENKTLSITGGAEEGEYIIKDYNYMDGVYFFIDKKYRDEYKKIDSTGIHGYDLQNVITNFEIYKSGPGYEQKEGRVRGWALIAPDSSRDTTIINSENARGFWIRMEQQKDYFLWTDLGKIKLFVPVSDNEMLAVAYKTAGGEPVGDVFFNPQVQSTIFLKMLKPQSPRPSDITWDLMQRNVYYLGARNIDPDGFEVKIFFDTPSGNDEESYESRSYLNIFGLDRFDLNGNPNPDNVVDDNPNFLRLGDGEIEFPSLKPFADATAFSSDKPGLPENKFVTKMYTSTIQSEIANDSKFYIQVKSKNRSANYDLGFNVIEGSEEVTLNGQRLNKDTDYIIDYFSGKLTILREEATNPSANVQVNYQRNEMFQLEKKTLLGMRGDYKFWENSFIGGTFLYLNQSTLDQKVRVGKGPMRNLIWDVNTSLKFEPNFLTKAIDAFPIIETKAPSRFNFEGEIAQILPNPNTLNNESTDDPDGVAYIDDFEAAKKITPLGVIRNGWRECSSPLEIGKIPDPTNGWRTTFNVYKKRGLLKWWNPYEQRLINDIWPNRDTSNPNTPQRVHVLVMKFDPVTKDKLPNDPEYKTEQSWGGIMRWLSAGYADQSDSKFLEIWINHTKGSRPRLHIDLGQISEDVIPNGELDTEDIPLNGIRNNLLDPGEDVGIDHMPGKDPADWWDINKNGVRDEGEPLSLDDWEYSTASSSYDKINGTEGNENDPGGRYPDTEDLNGNSSLDMRNDYFEYTFSMALDNPDTAYIKGGQDNPYGWRMYRIPLNDFKKKVGDPDMSRIEFARIWMDSCTTETMLEIAEINLVGNDWREMGVALNDESPYDPSNDTTVVAAVTNTHDNDDYLPPPGVRGVIDRVYRIESKEQSLVMQINDLKTGANGILRKTFFQSENYINYKKMKMFVHGGDRLGTNFPKDRNSTSIELFLRFGSDDNNYYEFRELVFEGWEGNDIEIDLDALAALKQNIAKIDTVTGIIDSSFADGIKHYRIKGRPALTNIRQLVLGVKNISNNGSRYSAQTPFSEFSGEIWVNELRLSGVRKDKGFAYRARGELQVADVFSINGEINKRDADFHNINERFGGGNNETASNFSGNLSLHKFLPKSWGISLPVNFNYSRRVASPKYLPGSDILYELADDSKKMVSRSASESYGWGTSFKKNTRSNNFFIKNTIDQIAVSYNTAQSYDTTSTHRYSTRTSHAANISYSFPFPRDKSIRPFKWLGNAPIIKALSDLQFFYLPTNFSVRAAGNISTSKAETRDSVITNTRQTVISRDVQMGIQPFKSLDVDFSRSYKNDLRNSPDPWKSLRSFQFGTMTDLDQSFSTKYNPQIFRWLKTSFNYSAGFKYSNNLLLKDRGGLSASNNTSRTGSFTFDPDQLIKSIFKSTPAAHPPATRTRPPVIKQPEKKEESEENQKEKEEKQEEKKTPGISPFKMVLNSIQFFTSRIQPITFNYTDRKNLSQNGLDPDGALKFPTLAYMFGFSDTTGMASVASVGTNTGSSRLSTNISLSSGLKIIKQMDMSIKYNFDKSRSQSTTTTGDKSFSWFYIDGDSPDKDKLGIPIPEWSLRWMGLEQIKFIKKFVQRMSFDHSFSGRQQQSWQNIEQNFTRINYTKQFRPLAGFNLTFQKNINMNLRYNWAEDVNLTMTHGLEGRNTCSGGQKNVSSDLAITASYSHSGGLRLPFPFMKNKELKNNIDIQVTLSWNNNVGYQKVGDQDWTSTKETSSLNFEPTLTYSFSQNVRGGMNFKFGKNSNKVIGDTKILEFGIHVSIIISGR